MSSRKSNEFPEMPPIYTVEDIARKTGLSTQAISSRMKSRAAVIGPYRKIRGVYVFSARQFERLCENWGKGQDAVRLHAAYREARELSPAGRKAS